MVKSSMFLKIDDIPKFDGTYFYVWQKRMKLYLDAENLVGIVEGTTPKPNAATAPPDGVGSVQEWETLNKIALSFIANRLDNSQFHHISSLSTAAEAWTKLSDLYQAQDAVTRMYLLDELQTLKMKEGDSVTKHVHVFKTLIDQLSAAGLAVDDENQYLQLMRSMPESFRTPMSTLRANKNLDLQTVITFLLREEKIRKTESIDSSSALYVGREASSSYQQKSRNYPSRPGGSSKGFYKPKTFPRSSGPSKAGLVLLRISLMHQAVNQRVGKLQQLPNKTITGILNAFTATYWVTTLKIAEKGLLTYKCKPDFLLIKPTMFLNSYSH